MNIDAKIQEILLRSSPVNDNKTPQSDTKYDKPNSQINGISIVGDRNVVIYSNLISALLTFTVAYLMLIYIR